MKLKIVENWRSLWRAFSVQAMGLSSSVLITWGLLPDDMRAAIPADVIAIAAGGTLVLGVIGRFIKQDKVSGE